VTVLENGQPVNNLQVDLPGKTGSASLGVVLLIDGSLTMRGNPIAQAMAAARAFAARRGQHEQISVIIFNSKLRALLPLTSDGTLIGKALARKPQLVYGTHVFNAIVAATKLLQRSAISVGSIVLLTDGQNVGSTVTERAALALAKAGRVRIFTVGLRSPAFFPTRLSRMASTTGGTFAVASKASDLKAIFDALGKTISSQYLIQYRSLSGPAQRVYITVKVAGFPGAAVASYLTPGIPASIVIHQTLWDRILASPYTAVAVALLVAALIGFAVFLFARRRDRRLEQRIAQFTSSTEAAALARRHHVEEEIEEKEAKSLAERGWHKRLLDDIEIGRVEMSPARIMSLTALASVALGIVAWVVIGNPLGLLGGLVVPFVVRWLIGFRARRLRAEFAEQLPDNLDVVSAALRAGHSLVGGLTVTVEAAGEPSKREFSRALADEQLGVPLDEALRLVAKRMDNRDLIQVSLVARLQREAGTNAAEVLEQVATNVRHQMELRRLIKTLTAQGRMARWIVSALPLFLFGALYSLNKAYLAPLWNTNIGIVGICGAAVMVFAGSFAIKKIVEIEV